MSSSKAQEETLNSMYDLGLRLFYGLGEPQDTSRGLELLEQAGMQGHCEAAFLAGDIYGGGYNCEKDLTKARMLFTAAFMKGSVQAGKYLIPMLKKGIGGPNGPFEVARLRFDQ